LIAYAALSARLWTNPDSASCVASATSRSVVGRNFINRSDALKKRRALLWRQAGGGLHDGL
jgi:hypothetical protein